MAKKKKRTALLGRKAPTGGTRLVTVALLRSPIRELWKVGGMDLPNAIGIAKGWSKSDVEIVLKALKKELPLLKRVDLRETLEAASLLFLASFLRPNLPSGWNSKSHNHADGNKPSKVQKSLIRCAETLPNLLPKDTPDHARFAANAIHYFVKVDSIACIFAKNAPKFERKGLRIMKVILGDDAGVDLAKKLLERFSRPIGLLGSPLLASLPPHSAWKKRVGAAEGKRGISNSILREKPFLSEKVRKLDR